MAQARRALVCSCVFPSLLFTCAVRVMAKGSGTSKRAQSTSAPESASKRVQKRTAEEKIERAINLHFPEVSKTRLETHRVKDLLLRERVSKDMAEGASARLGKRYWEGIAAEYGFNESAEALKVKDKTQVISSELWAALERALSTDNKERSTEPLLTFLRQCKSMNQREFVGTWFAINDSKTLSRTAKEDCRLEFLKFIGRSDSETEHKEEVTAMIPTLDGSLAKHFARLKSQGVSEFVWLAAHKHECTVIMDKSDLDPVLACAGDVESVAAQLARLIPESRTAAAVFDFAQRKISSQAVSASISEKLQDVIAAGFSVDSMAQYKQDCEKLIPKTVSAKVATKREIKIEVLGMTTLHAVMDWQSEVELRLAGAIRQATLGAPNGLKMLPHEEWIVKATDIPKSHNVPAEVLADLQNARSIATDLLDIDVARSFCDVQNALGKASKSLLALDRSFRIELQFMSDGAEAGLEAAAQRLVLDALPSSIVGRTLAESSSLLDGIRDKPFWKFCSLKAQAQVDCVRELVAGMKQNVSPKAEIVSGGGFYVEVLKRLEWFMTHTCTDNGAKEVVRGKDALDRAWGEVAASIKSAPSTISYGHLEVFHTFKWMLDAPKVAELAEMVATILKQSAATKSKPAGRASGSAPPIVSRKNVKSSKESKGADMNQFFG